MGQYKVLSPAKSGGKLREIGEKIDLDEATAAGLRPGLVEAVAEKKGATVPPAPTSAAPVVPPVVVPTAVAPVAAAAAKAAAKPAAKPAAKSAKK